MRGSYIFTGIVVLSVCSAFAQPQAAVEENHVSTAKAARPSGGNSTFFIVAEFTQDINVKKLKPGAAIKAHVAQDLLWHGRILIPFDSKLAGHVTEIEVRSPDNPESRLGIVFDKMFLKHHREVDFQGVIEVLKTPAPRPSKLDEPDQMLPPAMRGMSSRGWAGSMGDAGMNSAVFVNGTPGSNAGNSAGGDLRHPSQGTSANSSAATPISAGMPRGVYGIKGLQLSAGSASTPGPVIVSSESDIKLEYGTQVLIRATNPHLPKN